MDNQSMGLLGFVVVCMLVLLWAISGKNNDSVTSEDVLIEESVPAETTPKREDTNTIIKRNLQPNP